jgi:hypothetical protein
MQAVGVCWPFTEQDGDVVVVGQSTISRVTRSKTGRRQE